MWKTVILFVMQASIPLCVLGESAYECGDHGRFEYCIDEIPGCVIGCHCHPGYYFDTDTKICEPNSRLLEQRRRHKEAELAQLQKVTSTPTVLYETSSGASKIDGHVDEITKDANDLGDWLYNQFFKTIENQVINNNTSDKDLLTRRSGSQQQVVKPRSKNKHRKGKLSKSQRKGKKKQLKRKLLRITENDSLFDLSSKSKSESSDSSSSDSSIEYETKEYDHNHNDDEHGHKKIVMINKKPKQPLPSFIFLPNMETPFYPPIGLPPPPIVPMYPMVPVPPVPLFQISVKGDSSPTTCSTATTETPSTATASTAIVTSNTPLVTTLVTTTDSITTTELPSSAAPSLRQKNKKRKKGIKTFDSDKPYPDNSAINNLKPIDRQKMLKRLREKMSNPSAKLFMPSWKRNKKIFANTLVNPNADPESQFPDKTLSDDVYPNNVIPSKHIQEDLSYPGNVDFKYMTELIHRVNFKNKTNNFPPIEYRPQDDPEMFQQSKMYDNGLSDYSVPFNEVDGRRSPRPAYPRSDESYYTSLGRQIAKMIRNIDSPNTQVSIELEETPSKVDSYFNNNSPRSFWERSVRSPLTYLQANNKKFEYLKRSNEMLFNIENKVEIMASTVPTLSLQEIENIVNVLETANVKDKIKDEEIKNIGIFNKNVQVNLWPQGFHRVRNNIQNVKQPAYNKKNQRNSINNLNTTISKTIKAKNSSPGINIHNNHKSVAWNDPRIKGNQVSKNGTFNVKTVNNMSNKNNPVINPNNYNLGPQYDIINLPTKNSAFPLNRIKQPLLNQQLNPLFLGHRKYFQDNTYDGRQDTEFSHLFKGAKPSYFHYGLNHFDYVA